MGHAAASSIAAASPVYPYEGTLEDEQGNPIRIPAHGVSPDFFEVFRSSMTLGRAFLPEEDQPSSPVEVVVSHQLWQSALGGDPEIIGTSITIDAGTAPKRQVVPTVMAPASDPGFETREALTFNLIPPIGAYQTPEAVAQFHEQLIGELRSARGVDAVTAMATMPLSSEYDPYRPGEIAELPTPEAGEEPQTYQRSVYAGFFDARGIPLVEGRVFDDFDNPEGAAVAIVNEAFVRRNLPDGRAIDREITLFSANFWPLGAMMMNPVRVVGVVGDVPYAGLTEEPQPTIYFPFLQAPFRRLTYLMTSQGEASDLMTTARERVSQVDAQIAINGIRTLDEVMRATTVSQRFMATLLLVFGIVALVLATVGIYGVVTYQVTERTREMAVRMSIGATPAVVLRES